MITGTVPVEVPRKLSELELDAGGKRIDNLGLGDTPDDVMRRSEKTGSYEVYGLLATGLAADRPAPGIVDRFYFSTGTLVLERDTGAAWVEVVRGEAATRLAQLAERAHSSLTGIGVGDHHARYTDAEAQAQAAALIVIHAAIAAAHHTKTTDAAEITSGTFPVVRGGTGLNTIALGGILYASALDVLSRLAPTAANQVLRSTAANALQFAALLAADIPNLDAGKITSGAFALARIPNMDWAHISGLFPRTIADLLSDHNLANHPLAIIPTMDLAHIPSGIQGKLTAACAYKYAHPSARQCTTGSWAWGSISGKPTSPSLEEMATEHQSDGTHGAITPTSCAQKYTHPTTGICPQAPKAHNQDASTITSGRFPMTRMPDMALNKIMVGRGAGNSPVEENKPTGISSGLIVMWHGTIANIPAGWVVCDGNNSTPNLLTRFVQGVATAATNPGATGGATSKTIPTHQLTVSEMPKHRHEVGGENTAGPGTGKLDLHDYPSFYSRKTSYVGGDGYHGHGSIDIHPKFYDVAFLMKT